MSAIGQALKLASRAGAPRAAKVMFGLTRMHWRYFVFGRGRGLAKLLPLAAPLKVHVDPASGCNFRCYFCPQANPDALRQAGVEFRSMTLPLFRKMIDDFGAFPRRVDELVLGNYGEPLLNKNLPEMIRYAKASGYVREVSVITNASLLDRERAELLAAAGPDKVRISIEAMSDASYLDTTGIPQKFTDIVENIKGLKDAVRRHRGNTFIYTKIIDTGLSESEQQAFFQIFAPLADALAIENLMGITPRSKEIVGGQPKGMTGVSLSAERRVCPSPFYSLSIHSNGDVGVCCIDWHHKTIVGSIAKNTVREIWEGEALRSFRVAQLAKSWRGVDACAGCEMVKHYPSYEDLDSNSEELLKVFEGTAVAASKRVDVLA